MGHLKIINFPFGTNGKLMVLGVPVFKHFRVNLMYLLFDFIITPPPSCKLCLLLSPPPPPPTRKLCLWGWRILFSCRRAQSVACLTQEPEIPGSIPGPATYFHFPFRWFRAVVSYWQKYLYEVLVRHLGGLSLSRKIWLVNWPSRNDHSCLLRA